MRSKQAVTASPRSIAALVVAVLACSSACGDDDADGTGSGGGAGMKGFTGGASAGGAGGQTASGGASSRGGNPGRGGALASGGVVSSGGASEGGRGMSDAGEGGLAQGGQGGAEAGAAGSAGFAGDSVGTGGRTSGGGSSQGGARGGSTGAGGTAGSSNAGSAGSSAGGSVGSGGTANRCPASVEVIDATVQCPAAYSVNECGSGCNQVTSHDCLACESVVSDGTADCGYAAGNVQAGPALGRARAAVCVQAVECFRQANCAGPDALPCYCGTSGSNCFAGARNGPCADIIEIALETTDASEIAMRFTNAEYGGGVAILRMASDWDNCKTVCFPGK
jgi:hypothetical protein